MVTQCSFFWFCTILC